MRISMGMFAPEMTRSEMRRGTVGRPADLATWELVIRAQALILDGAVGSTDMAVALADELLAAHEAYLI